MYIFKKCVYIDSGPALTKALNLFVSQVFKMEWKQKLHHEVAWKLNPLVYVKCLE